MIEETLIQGVIQGGTAGLICYMLIRYTNVKLDKIISILEEKKQ